VETRKQSSHHVKWVPKRVVRHMKRIIGPNLARQEDLILYLRLVALLASTRKEQAILLSGFPFAELAAQQSRKAAQFYKFAQAILRLPTYSKMQAMLILGAWLNPQSLSHVEVPD